MSEFSPVIYTTERNSAYVPPTIFSLTRKLGSDV